MRKAEGRKADSRQRIIDAVLAEQTGRGIDDALTAISLAPFRFSHAQHSSGA